jgi:hypothetical protein
MRLAILVGGCQFLAAQPPLTVVDTPLPPIEVGVEFHAQLHAAGGVPPYSWSVTGGEVPEGITLSGDGLLAGRPTKPGAFTLTLKVQDSAHPANTLDKEFHAEVAAALSLEWLQPAAAGGNRIDGSVQISNGTKDVFDLTVIIEAVAESGRATAIGYEHFNLKPGTNDFKVPFGDTLPHGAYVVNVDAIAEIPARNVILRRRLQSAHPLQVTQGP